jgi:PAS domain S-box-containing protein
MQSSDFLKYECEFKRKDGSTFTGYINSKIIRDKNGKPKNIFGFMENITERKNIENKLYETNSILDAIFQGSAVSIYIKDIMGKYLMVNSACLKLLNKNLVEIIGKDDRAVFSASEAKNIMKMDRKIILSGEPMTFEETIEINNCTYNLLTTKKLYCDSLGKAIGLVGVTIDITHMKKAEEAQRISEDKYKTLIENMPEAVYNMDYDGHITYISPVIEKLTKYKVHEFLYKPFTDFIHKDDIKALVEDFKKTLKGNLNPAEFRVMDKDGGIIYVRTKSQPIIQNSKVIGLTGIISNITQLKLSEEKFYKAFHSNSNLMLISEFPEIKFVEINKTFLDVLGFKKEEVVGKNPKELNIIFDNKSWNELLKLLGNGSKVKEIEQIILTKSGEKRLVKFTGELFIIQDKNYLLGEMHDITELKTAEEKKDQSLAEMKILSETAYGLLKCNTILEIHQLVGEKIMELLKDDIYLMVSDYDEKTDSIHITKLFGVEKYLSSVINLLGKSPFDIKPKLSEMAEEDLKIFSSNKLERLPGGFHSLSARKIPKSICTAIETILGIKSIYVMGFNIQDKHYAGVTILNKKDNNILHKSLIETIINQAAVVVHRKKIEDILKRSDDKYRDVIDNAYEAIYVVQDYNIVFANPKTFELSGYTVDEFINKPISEIIYKDDLKNIKKMYEERIKGIHNTSFNRLRYYHKNDGIHWCQIKATRMLWDGKPAMLVFSLDITEQIKVEQELEHRKKIEELVNNLSNHFLKIPNNKFESEIERDLAILGEFVCVDRCMISLFSEDKSKIEYYNEWKKIGIIENISKLKGLEISQFDWVFQMLDTDNYIYIPKITELPEVANIEKIHWQNLNYKSLLIFSLNIDNTLTGYFGFATETFEKEWSNQDILLLQLISNVFSNALKRQRSE